MTFVFGFDHLLPLPLLLVEFTLLSNGVEVSSLLHFASDLWYRKLVVLYLLIVGTGLWCMWRTLVSFMGFGGLTTTLVGLQRKLLGI